MILPPAAEAAELAPVGFTAIASTAVGLEVIAAAQAGDHAAFEQIFQTYEPPIYGYVFRLMGGDHHDAVDLTQDTFLKAYLGLPRTTDDLRLAPWLYRIATNVCLDELRHRKLVKWMPWDGVWGGGSRRSLKGHGQLVSIDRLDYPDEVVEAGEDASDVQRTLARLSPTYRAVLVLREYHDLTYNEIAQVLNSTRPAVKSLLFRARNVFRAQWLAQVPA